jgi:hypothetical protein
VLELNAAAFRLLLRPCSHYIGRSGNRRKIRVVVRTGLPTLHRNRLKLIPGTETNARTVEWLMGDTFKLEAPIPDFTIQQVLNRDFRAQVAKVLKFWVGYDLENLFRIRNASIFSRCRKGSGTLQRLTGCSSTLTGRIAAKRRHGGGAGHVRHGGPVR